MEAGIKGNNIRWRFTLQHVLLASLVIKSEKLQGARNSIINKDCCLR